MKKTRAYISSIGMYVPERRVTNEELAKTGDYELGETVGEYGFVVAYNKAHSILSGYSTTA